VERDMHLILPCVDLGHLRQPEEIHALLCTTKPEKRGALTWRQILTFLYHPALCQPSEMPPCLRFNNLFIVAPDIYFEEVETNQSPFPYGNVETQFLMCLMLCNQWSPLRNSLTLHDTLWQYAPPLPQNTTHDWLVVSANMEIAPLWLTLLHFVVNGNVEVVSLLMNSFYLRLNGYHSTELPVARVVIMCPPVHKRISLDHNGLYEGNEEEEITPYCLTSHDGVKTMAIYDAMWIAALRGHEKMVDFMLNSDDKSISRFFQTGLNSGAAAVFAARSPSWTMFKTIYMRTRWTSSSAEILLDELIHLFNPETCAAQMEIYGSNNKSDIGVRIFSDKLLRLLHKYPCVDPQWNRAWLNKLFEIATEYIMLHMQQYGVNFEDLDEMIIDPSSTQTLYDMEEDVELYDAANDEDDNNMWDNDDDMMIATTTATI
jgi:hypothetical protein